MIKLQVRPTAELDLGKIVERLSALVQAALEQVGSECTEERIADVIQRSAVLEVQTNMSTVERIESALLDEDWWALPDIAESLGGLLGEMYVAFAQKNIDAIWQRLYGAGKVDSITAPGVRLDVADDVVSHASDIMDRIDQGTIAYLSTFLSQAELTHEELIHHLFSTGNAGDATLLDQRVQSITSSETSWIGNRCRLTLIEFLGQKKAWTIGSPACDFAEASEAEGFVSPDHVYGTMKGISLLHPPGCLGCSCFIQSGVDALPIEVLSDAVGKSETGESCMVALDVPPEFGTLLGTKDPHVTLMYIGKVGEDVIGKVNVATRRAIVGQDPFSIWLTGHIATLGPPDEGVDAALVALSSPLKMLNDRMKTELEAEGVLLDKRWVDYKPHVTLSKAGMTNSGLIKDFGGLWLCSGLRVWHGDETEYFPFVPTSKE